MPATSARVPAIKFATGLVGLLLVFVVPSVLPKLFVALLTPPPHLAAVGSN